MSKKASDYLVETVKQLFGDQEYADLKIICGSRTWMVHKAIVCPQSDFFRAACKKDTFKEGKENVITLTSDDHNGASDNPEIVGLMIEFMYCADYKVVTTMREGDRTACPETAKTDETTATHAKVFALAEKYGVAGLQKAAWEKFGDHMIFTTPSVHDLAVVIRVVYTSIQDPTSQDTNWQYWLFCEICQVSKAERNVLQDAEFRAAVQSIDGLAYDIVLHQARAIKDFYPLRR